MLPRRSIFSFRHNSFIDLFSTLIMFLIATSVWQQLAAVPVNLGGPSAEDRTVSQPNKNDIKSVKSDVRITLAKESVVLFDNGVTKTFTMNEAKANDPCGRLH